MPGATKLYFHAKLKAVIQLQGAKNRRSGPGGKLEGVGQLHEAYVGLGLMM